MRVAVDIRTLAFTRAGISRYVSGLLVALAAREDVEVIPLSVPAWLRPIWSTTVERWWEDTWAPRRIRRAGCDVVHGTRFWVPEVDGAPAVATIYELSFETAPEVYSPEAREYFTARTRQAIARAAVLVTMAESVKRELVTRYRVSEERVEVVPPGIPEGFGPAEAPGAREPVVLAVGTVEPRKNFPVLIEALAQVRARRPEVRLVIAGRRDRGWPAVQEAMKVHRQGDAVRLVEGPSDAELVELYRAAAAVACPSLDEGFGFPALEAMACGVPVVAARRGSLPEVVGDAGLLVEPEPGPLAVGLLHVLDDQAFSDRLSREGPVRASKFTWKRAAERMVAAYRRAARA